MAKIILLTGTIVGYAYLMELFIAYYSGNPFEKFAFFSALGPYGWYWWVGMILCNALSPQFFWLKWCRRNVFVVFFVCMCVNVGMWFERFIIIVAYCSGFSSLVHGECFTPTWVEIWTFVGTFGIFTLTFPPFHSLPADDRDVVK